MIEKVRSIARSHGPFAVVRRALRRFAAEIGASARAFRHRLGNRLLVRLPPRIVPVAIASSAQPDVSIVVPVYNRRRCTNACLIALARAWPADVAAEVIVVDDASTDDTPQLLARCSGVRVLRRERNGGFGEAANAGAAVARGAYLFFLNNDAFVTRGWLRALLDAFDDVRVGAAASQLRHADGTLDEAGGVIWRDGRGSNYGRDARPGDERFSYARDVDYGSGAALMVRATAFADAGGFSQAYVRGYYEDADLCFALREHGLRVRYVPRSVVVHVGGMTYGSNVRRDAVAQQARSRETFVQRRHADLQAHLPPEPAMIEVAARRLCGNRTLLVVDERVPLRDQSAGALRMARIVEIVAARGWHVIFGSMDRRLYEPYAEALRRRGVEIVAGFSAHSLAALRAAALRIDAVWLARPGPARALLDRCRDAFPDARVLYDTVDLHHLRLEGEERVSGRRTAWERVRAHELGVARRADVVVVTSPQEGALLVSEGVANVAVVPIVEPAVAREPVPWERREGVIFVGNYSHAPNEDAAEWLCAEIMPLVWERRPDLHLTLAGAEPTQRVRALGGERVAVTGFVADLEELLARRRVFVAPLRFGAGMKGKIVQALANGLPVVTTETGDEGIGVAPNGGIVGGGAAEIAAAVTALDGDRELWQRLAAGAPGCVAAFAPERVARTLDEILAPREILVE